MKKSLLLLGLSALTLNCLAKQEYDIAAFVWPAYHPEPRWQKDLNVFKDNIGEWEAIKDAKAKFRGHDQPRVPLWGYEDESKTEVMEKKIEAASSHGVNVFIFDWYWYDGKPFLEEALNNGFLKAKNKEKMKFYLMWANHSVDNEGWDHKKPNKTFEKIVWDGKVDFDEFKKIVARTIEKYFKDPSYYKIDNKPVYAIYGTRNLIYGLGGIEKTKEAIAYFDQKCKEAGFAGVHIQMIYRNMPKILAEMPDNIENGTDKAMEYIGVSSYSTYQWMHYIGADGRAYKDWGRMSIDRVAALTKDSKIPLFPHVSIGWDNNARFVFEDLTPIVFNATPVLFEKFLKEATELADKKFPNGPKLITVNSWNEWAEGSYLEPDETFGYGYLEAVRRVILKK